MFHKCNSLEEAKSLFRKLAMYLHPDRGGDAALMALLIETYENYKTYAFVENPFRNKTKEKKKEYETSIEDIYKNDERLKIIEEILAYSKNHPRFDPSFTESIAEFLEENGFITSSQYNSLQRVYHSFRMDRKNPDQKKE